MLPLDGHLGYLLLKKLGFTKVVLHVSMFAVLHAILEIM